MTSKAKATTGIRVGPITEQGNDYKALLQAVDRLAEILPRGPLQRMASGVLHTTPEDDTWPDPRQLLEVLAEFKRLAREKQLKLLNGWDAEFFMPREEPEFVRYGSEPGYASTDDEFLRCLEAVAYDGTDDRPLIRRACAFFDNLAPQVRVQVSCGMERKEAVAALRAIADRLEREWVKLAGGEDDEGDYRVLYEKYGAAALA